MANRRFIRLSPRCRVVLIVFVAIAFAAELMALSVLARKYYDLNVRNLQLVADTAARVGARYLPADPHAAVRAANAYAQSHGIERTEIVLTELSWNDNVLTIRLDRKICVFIAMFALGELPARYISVTASARRQYPRRASGIRILDTGAFSRRRRRRSQS
jgi:hypothetical protein